MNEMQSINPLSNHNSMQATEISPTYWTVVSQVKSNRVVYFTDDPEYQPPMEGDWYYCSSYMGELPKGITLRNCWGWRFNGGVFKDAREMPKSSAEETIIESNRKALRRILLEKIEIIRKPFLPSCQSGDVIRREKLAQAKQFLANADSGSDVLDKPTSNNNFYLLESTAVSRNISMLEAARLIEVKAEETKAILLETERFREQLSQAILMATTQEQLLDLREWLLDKVYPELTRQFKFVIENTEPINFDRKLPDTQRLHEITRLKVQLREKINQMRKSLLSDYILNDEMQKYKLKIAKAVLLMKDEHIKGEEFIPLQIYADARNVSLYSAAELILNSAAASADLLLRTESIKDSMLAKIESIGCLRDIRTISNELMELQ